MDEVDSKLDRVMAPRVAHVVADLIFFLASFGREKGDWRRELVVPIGLETGDGEGGGTKGKGKREAQIRVARLRQVQTAGVENQFSQQVRREGILIANKHAEIVVMRKQPGRRECALLDQTVVGRVLVIRCAQMPLG